MPDVDLSALAPGWADLLGASEPWDPPQVTTMVVVPHPDDESLSTGGLLARLSAAGVETLVVAVTDGDAAYPGEVGGDRLASIRREEQSRALAELGVRAEAHRRLGFDDGGVAARESELATTIGDLVLEHRVAHVVAPWTGDHHPDHEAVGRAALAAARSHGVAVTFGLFWGLTLEDAPSDASVASRELRLRPEEVDVKARAIAAHVSQTTDAVVPEPVLHDGDLAVTRWPSEYYLAPVEP